jgi:hypothetical protein
MHISHRLPPLLFTLTSPSSSIRLIQRTNDQGSMTCFQVLPTPFRYPHSHDASYHNPMFYDGSDTSFREDCLIWCLALLFRRFDFRRTLQPPTPPPPTSYDMFRTTLFDTRVFVPGPLISPRLTSSIDFAWNMSFPCLFPATNFQ